MNSATPPDTALRGVEDALRITVRSEE